MDVDKLKSFIVDLSNVVNNDVVKKLFTINKMENLIILILLGLFNKNE